MSRKTEETDAQWKDESVDFSKRCEPGVRGNRSCCLFATTRNIPSHLSPKGHSVRNEKRQKYKVKRASYPSAATVLLQIYVNKDVGESFEQTEVTFVFIHSSLLLHAFLGYRVLTMDVDSHIEVTFKAKICFPFETLSPYRN